MNAPIRKPVPSASDRNRRTAGTRQSSHGRKTIAAAIARKLTFPDIAYTMAR